MNNSKWRFFLPGYFLLIAALLILFGVKACHAQDTISVTPIPDNNGALIQSITKYSPTAAYNGLLINAKTNTVNILVAGELIPYVWRDTTIHSAPPFMNGSMLFPDSVWTAKEQSWICSLTVHGKLRMRQNIKLDSICKH